MDTSPRPNPQREPCVCQAETASESLASLREWIRDATEWGIPHFGEFGCRIRCYRDKLRNEFAAEVAPTEPKSESPHQHECRNELDQLKNQHAMLLDELEALASELTEESSLFDSWQEAVQLFEEIQTEVDRHLGREQQLNEAIERF